MAEGETKLPPGPWLPGIMQEPIQCQMVSGCNRTVLSVSRWSVVFLTSPLLFGGMHSTNQAFWRSEKVLRYVKLYTYPQREFHLQLPWNHQSLPVPSFLLTGTSGVAQSPFSTGEITPVWNVSRRAKLECTLRFESNSSFNSFHFAQFIGEKRGMFI